MDKLDRLKEVGYNIKAEVYGEDRVWRLECGKHVKSSPNFNIALNHLIEALKEEQFVALAKERERWEVLRAVTEITEESHGESY